MTKHEALLKKLVSIPTAPFQETNVIEFIKEWATSHKLRWEQDKAGNIFLLYKKGPASNKPWLFQAHMDHPGFVALKQKGKTLEADFRGGVTKSYFKGSRVCFFDNDKKLKGTVRSAVRDKKTGFLKCKIAMNKADIVPKNTIGCWDMPEYKRTGNRVRGRACDDLAGVAIILSTIEELIKNKARAHVIAMFTRAEEVGFVGAIDSCLKGSLPKHSLIVGMETSKIGGGVNLGDGAVVRVGDRGRTFDPALTMCLTVIAEKMAAQDKKFKHTRALMQGGMTETSGFMMYDKQASALSLPLNNFHNMGPKNKIAPELVDIRDYENLVKLMVGIATMNFKPDHTDELFKQRCEKRNRTLRKFL